MPWSGRAFSRQGPLVVQEGDELAGLLHRDVRVPGEGRGGSFRVAAAGQRADPSVDLVIEHIAAHFPRHVTLAGDGTVAIREALGCVVVVRVLYGRRGGRTAVW